MSLQIINLSKPFVFLEDNDKSFRQPIFKGITFKIVKTNLYSVTIKITNSDKELESFGMLDEDFNRLIKNYKEDIKIFERLIKMWDDEPDMFEVDPESDWNTKYNGHSINTSFNKIPLDNPNRSNDYSINTLDYRRKDGKLNIYSYQENNNSYYNRDCYYFMCEAKKLYLDKLLTRNPDIKKTIIKWIKDEQDISIEKLNKLKFDYK